MKYKRYGIKHCIGNIISGVCSIVDGVVLILSFGTITLNTALEWAIYRRNNVFLVDKVKNDTTK